MKSRFLFLLFLFYSCYTTAQISNADKKQLLKIIGEDFILLPNQKSYPYCDYSDSFKVDMSTSILNDTVGVSFHNEHLLWHDLISFCGKEEVLKLVKPSYVTVEEYLEFQNWVRDSIARDMIYLNESGRTSGYANREWTDDDSKDWIDYKDFYFDDGSTESVEFDPSDRALGRSLFNLNWDRPLNYNNPKIIPLIADIYYPQAERLYKQKEFDERKWLYKFNNYIIIPNSFYSNDSLLFPFQKFQPNKKNIGNQKIYLNEVTAVLSDNYNWAKRSQLERDEFSVLAHTYGRLFHNSPVIGINNAQTKAFCHWKQKMMEQELKRKELPFSVIISLPTVDDLEMETQVEDKLTIPLKDYTLQWKITNMDYLSFIKAVKDSILKDGLYLNMKSDDDAAKVIKYSEYYFDEGTLEYTEYDPSDRELGRTIFSQNNKFKLTRLDPFSIKIVDSVKMTTDYKNANFNYQFIDSKERSYIGKFEAKKNADSLYLVYDRTNSHKQMIGKNLNLSNTNQLGHSTGVRSHYNLQVFIKRIELPINVELSNQSMDSLIQTITYEQAIAFYYWKYPIHNPNPKDEWQKFVLPSKEQFEAVQSGKQVIVPEKKVAYPTPLFRYVVHVYPK